MIVWNLTDPALLSAPDLCKQVGAVFKRTGDSVYDADSYSIDDIYLIEGPAQHGLDGVWTVSEGVTIPGVRYTANGDGWPDDVDMVEMGRFPKFEHAFIAALALFVAYRAQTQINGLAEAAYWLNPDNP